MSKRGWFNREVFGWAMFDFANQAFTLVILTTMFHVYFVNHIVVGGPDPDQDDRISPRRKQISD